MKLNIDHLNTVTGWVVNSPSTIQTIQKKNLIAGLNTNSLMITFNSSDTTRTATKTFGTPFDVTDYETLIFSVFSYGKGENKQYLKPSDFAYKIDLDGVTEFYFPVYNNFTNIEIGIEDLTEINQIKITPLHTETDTIIISEMVAEIEEIQYDLLEAVKEHIDYYIESLWSDGLSLGTLSATAGDETLTLSNPFYLDRYGVIKITDGVNTETHQVEDNDTVLFNLNDNFDGGQILNTFVNADYYLQFPSRINPGQSEINLPGIAIWGIDPEAVLRGAKLDTIRDSFEVGGGSKERTEGQILKYTVLLTCEARAHELLDYMARAVRRFISQESLWVNGRRHDVSFSGPASELPPNPAGIEYMAQVQYSFDVEVKENINERVAVPSTVIINTTVTPQA